MARRTVLTARQREALFALPASEADLLRHCVLSDADLVHVRGRRRDRNRLGFALQLCAFRYPGRLIGKGEAIPEAMLAFVAAQLGLSGEAVTDYAARSETHYEHSSTIQQLYGYRPFEGMVREQFQAWLVEAAVGAHTSEALARGRLGVSAGLYAKGLRSGLGRSVGSVGGGSVRGGVGPRTTGSRPSARCGST